MKHASVLADRIEIISHLCTVTLWLGRSCVCYSPLRVTFVMHA